MPMELCASHLALSLGALALSMSIPKCPCPCVGSEGLQVFILPGPSVPGSSRSPPAFLRAVLPNLCLFTQSLFQSSVVL